MERQILWVQPFYEYRQSFMTGQRKILTRSGRYEALIELTVGDITSSDVKIINTKNCL